MSIFELVAILASAESKKWLGLAIAILIFGMMGGIGSNVKRR